VTRCVHHVKPFLKNCDSVREAQQTLRIEHRSPGVGRSRPDARLWHHERTAAWMVDLVGPSAAGEEHGTNYHGLAVERVDRVVDDDRRAPPRYRQEVRPMSRRPARDPGFDDRLGSTGRIARPS
jgi:hypothetical protein